MKSWWMVLGVLAPLVGCGGGGRYGYARSYVNLAEEEPFARRASESVYDEVRRMPHQHYAEVISWFGVVTDTTPGPDGQTRVAMEVRTHQERHLCEDREESTCRVTVSDQAGGPFSAVLRLSPDDRDGENRVQPGSLLRVYGELVQDEYDAQGGPLLRGRYYRHWPRGQYVTTAARGSWRQ